MNSRLTFAMGLVALVAISLGACSGGARPDFDEPLAADPTPTAGSASGADAEETPDPAPTDSEDAEADPSPEPTVDATADPSPEPTVDDNSDDDEATPTATPPPDDAVVPAPEVAAFPSQGTALIALADGRSFEGSVGCETRTNADSWVFRFGGTTDAGVELQGAYDSSQADFAIVFVSGANASSGEGVLLSNINGIDDFAETNDSGTEWIASMTLWNPDGQSFSAQLSANCG